MQKTQETWVWSLVRKISWNRKWQSTPVFFPGKSHVWRSLVGYSPWSRKKSDTTEHARTHTQMILANQKSMIWSHLGGYGYMRLSLILDNFLLTTLYVTNKQLSRLSSSSLSFSFLSSSLLSSLSSLSFFHTYLQRTCFRLYPVLRAKDKQYR